MRERSGLPSFIIETFFIVLTIFQYLQECQICSQRKSPSHVSGAEAEVQTGGRAQEGEEGGDGEGGRGVGEV